MVFGRFYGRRRCLQPLQLTERVGQHFLLACQDFNLDTVCLERFAWGACFGSILVDCILRCLDLLGQVFDHLGQRSDIGLKAGVLLGLGSSIELQNSAEVRVGL